MHFEGDCELRTIMSISNMFVALTIIVYITVYMVPAGLRVNLRIFGQEDKFSIPHHNQTT